MEKTRPVVHTEVQTDGKTMVGETTPGERSFADDGTGGDARASGLVLPHEKTPGVLAAPRTTSSDAVPSVRKHLISRRTMLRASALATAGAALSACGSSEKTLEEEATGEHPALRKLTGADAVAFDEQFTQMERSVRVKGGVDEVFPLPEISGEKLEGLAFVFDFFLKDGQFQDERPFTGYTKDTRYHESVLRQVGKKDYPLFGEPVTYAWVDHGTGGKILARANPTPWGQIMRLGDDLYSDDYYLSHVHAMAIAAEAIPQEPSMYGQDRVITPDAVAPMLLHGALSKEGSERERDAIVQSMQTLVGGDVRVYTNNEGFTVHFEPGKTPWRYPIVAPFGREWYGDHADIIGRFPDGISLDELLRTENNEENRRTDNPTLSVKRQLRDTLRSAIRTSHNEAVAKIDRETQKLVDRVPALQLQDTMNTLDSTFSNFGYTLITEGGQVLRRNVPSFTLFIRDMKGYINYPLVTIV